MTNHHLLTAVDNDIMINDEYENDFEKQELSKSEETKIYTEKLLKLSVQSSISNTKSSSSTSTRSSILSDIKIKVEKIIILFLLKIMIV